MKEHIVEIEEKPICTKIDVMQTLYPLKLSSPIFFTVEEYRDLIVVQNSDTESWASADNEFDAVEKLREELIWLYRDLRDTPDEKLGKKPLRWKKFLCSIISD